MTQTTTEKPWLPQVDEPQRWYDRFMIYVLLGSARSVDGAYRVASEKGTGRANSQWRAIARAWAWRERASAFDAVGYDELLRTESSRRRERRERRLQMIQEVINASYAGMRKAEMRKLGREDARELISQLRLIFRDGVKAEREEMKPETEAVADEAQPEQDEKSAQVLREVYGDEVEL